MKHSIQLLTLMGLAIGLLGGCSSSRLTGHDLDYTKEKTVPPLVMPAGMKSPVKEGYYVAPLNAETRQQAAMSLLPPGSNLKRFAHAKKHHKGG